MTSKSRRTLAVLACVLVAACFAVPWLTGSGPKESSATGAGGTQGAGPGAAGGAHALHTAVSGAGGGSSGGQGASGDGSGEGTAEKGPGKPKEKEAPRAPGLRLSVAVIDADAQAGEPVRARIRIENTAAAAITLCDPLLDFPRRVELLYRYRNLNYCAQCPPGPMQALDTTKLVEIQPGHGIETVIDLRPLFDSCLGFGEGPFRFRLAYRGNPSAVPAIVRAWNGDPARVATSDDLVFHAPVPAWFEEMGGDGELLNSLASRIEIWAPGSPEDDKVLEHVRSLGQPAVAALAIVAGRSSSTEPTAAIRARKAFLMLRHLGADALSVLRQVPATAAVDVAIGVIDEDERERSGAGPSEPSRPFRGIGGGAKGTSFVVSAMRPEITGSVSYTFDAAGGIYVTRWESRDRKTTTALPLTTDQVAEVKRTILRARPWTWRPMRAVARAGEGEVGFALADHDGSTLWLQSFRGDEARDGNPFSSDVLRAFRIAAGDDGVPDPAPAAPAPAPRVEKAEK